MARVVAMKEETLDSLLRRFKQQVKKDNIIGECRKREYFIPKPLARKIKSENAQKLKRKKKRK